MSRSGTLAAAVMAAILVSEAAHAEDPWPAIRESVFGARELRDGSAIIALEAPARAEDAAIVPVTVRALVPQTPERYIRSIRLVIDQNPAPVAGLFRLFQRTGDATIATRVRVNEYTNLHAVAEMSDGTLYAVERFVKAAGGCSAPSLKDKDLAMARLGRMQLKPLTPWEPGVPNRLQLLVSHPNYTGMQIDQLSRNWIPPDYVRSVRISYGDQPVLEAETDISIAEDPAIGFAFVPTGPGSISVEVEDSQGRRFTRDWPVGPTS